jgi:predicted transglutaminase-like protease
MENTIKEIKEYLKDIEDALFCIRESLTMLEEQKSKEDGKRKSDQVEDEVLEIQIKKPKNPNVIVVDLSNFKPTTRTVLPDIML